MYSVITQCSVSCRGILGKCVFKEDNQPYIQLYTMKCVHALMQDFSYTIIVAADGIKQCITTYKHGFLFIWKTAISLKTKPTDSSEFVIKPGYCYTN